MGGGAAGGEQFLDPGEGAGVDDRRVGRPLGPDPGVLWFQRIRVWWPTSHGRCLCPYRDLVPVERQTGLANLNTFDFVVIFLLSNVVQNAIIGNGDSRTLTTIIRDGKMLTEPGSTDAVGVIWGE